MKLPPRVYSNVPSTAPPWGRYEPPPQGWKDAIARGTLPRGVAEQYASEHMFRCLCGHLKPAHDKRGCAAKGCRKLGDRGCDVFRQSPTFLIPEFGSVPIAILGPFKKLTPEHAKLVQEGKAKPEDFDDG